MSEIDELRERLAAAEQVCVLVGWSAIGNQTDPLQRALTQAWLDWTHRPDVGQPDPQSPEWQARVQDLANRRTATRTLTLGRLRDLIDPPEAQP
jgi:hypothetical protein